MDIEPYKTPNHIECIRCGKCKKNCPTKAITSVFLNPSADSRKAKIKTTARVIESEK
ncbi:4Fe-4S binding protein [Desulfosporosinus meridiei]|uniref:4Fe-4S binding protein n=1 Tax=Desulfosporosinus meridiei TaxID=79209 RepID=UPI0002D4CE29|nr:4Fe-4S binding protein [Desulfosporosinus meridiei]